mgnify:CR=1 FL=1
MIIVIRTKDGQKYWAEDYQEKDGFIVFDSFTKDGAMRRVQVNKTEVLEISQMNKDFPSKKK